MALSEGELRTFFAAKGQERWKLGKCLSMARKNTRLVRPNRASPLGG
jgi:hypothetical protein